MVEFLIGGKLSEDSDRVWCCEVGVLWCLRGGVSVAVILEGPPCVVHFSENDLATVEGL